MSKNITNYENLYELSATEAIKLFSAGKITPSDLIESIITRIKIINPITNAFIHLNHSRTLGIAKNFDKKLANNENIGPLFGVPVGIKDIFNSKDFPTEMGSPLWKDFTPGNDSRVVHYIRSANGLIIGKTETAEFAVHALGKSLNPYDPTRSPGTSSSGSAIAVATSIVPLALGTQTAGSIIRPASYCGIYGFKPSFGLLPRVGMLKTTDSLDQIGFFARTPHDLELLFDIIRVKGMNYPLSHKALTDQKRQTISDRKWRIKFTKSPVWDKADDYTKSALENFVKKISSILNFEIEEYSLPKEFDSTHYMHQIIYAKSLSYYFKEELKQKNLVSKIFYEFASKARNISVENFDNAIDYQNMITRKLDKEFEKFDIIISLSTATHAPLRNEPEKDDPSLIWTMCGVPTINVPALKSNESLPLGVQIVARKYNDKLLLNFVKELYQKDLIKDGPYPKLKL